jgi:2-iminobutanoate/2-iminopropanoate deaminase
MEEPMRRQAITSGRIAPPAGPFSPAIQAGGMIYLSGQVGQDPVTGRLVDGDATRQMEQVLNNVRSVLEAAGRSLADVVRVGIYLTDMRDFQAINSVYARHFEAPYPARTTVAVAALPLGAAVELDLIAG